MESNLPWLIVIKMIMVILKNEKSRTHVQSDGMPLAPPAKFRMPCGNQENSREVGVCYPTGS